MQIRTFLPKGSFGSNTYLCSEGGSSFLVDASVDYGTVREQTADLTEKPAFVLLTHGHFDHIWALQSYRDVGIPIFLSEEDAPMLRSASLNASAFFAPPISFDFEGNPLHDGDAIPFAGETIRVLSTPGHTPGSACFLIGSTLFTGDTIFARGSYGRCDLPLGDAGKLRASLEKLSHLERDLTILPGHGEEDRLGASLARLFPGF